VAASKRRNRSNGSELAPYTNTCDQDQSDTCLVKNEITLSLRTKSSTDLDRTFEEELDLSRQRVIDGFPACTGVCSGIAFGRKVLASVPA
jgi:hypothetical protein